MSGIIVYLSKNYKDTLEPNYSSVLLRYVCNNKNKGNSYNNVGDCIID